MLKTIEYYLTHSSRMTEHKESSFMVFKPGWGRWWFSGAWKWGLKHLNDYCSIMDIVPVTEVSDKLPSLYFKYQSGDRFVMCDRLYKIIQSRSTHVDVWREDEVSSRLPDYEENSRWECFLTKESVVHEIQFNFGSTYSYIWVISEKQISCSCFLSWQLFISVNIVILSILWKTDQENAGQWS
jgi:hypothetical protein